MDARAKPWAKPWHDEDGRSGDFDSASRQRQDALSVTNEVWITGGGMVSALGDGEEAQWQGLARAAAGELAIDSRSVPPFHIFPIRELDLDRHIPRKGDQRAMGPLMHYGVAAAGLALAEAGIAGDAALLGRTHLITAVGPGERDEAVDEQIMTLMMGEGAGAALLNEQLSNNLRPRSQVDADCCHGSFDTKAGLTAVVSSLSRKRAITIYVEEAWHRYSALAGVFQLKERGFLVGGNPGQCGQPRSRPE